MDDMPSGAGMQPQEGIAPPPAVVKNWLRTNFSQTQNDSENMVIVRQAIFAFKGFWLFDYIFYTFLFIYLSSFLFLGYSLGLLKNQDLEFQLGDLPPAVLEVSQHNITPRQHN